MSEETDRLYREIACLRAAARPLAAVAIAVDGLEKKREYMRADSQTIWQANEQRGPFDLTMAHAREARRVLADTTEIETEGDTNTVPRLLWDFLRAIRPIARIEEKLDKLIHLEEQNMATLADLKSRVDAQGTTINSAITLINGISTELKAALASNDPNAVQAIIDELDAQDQALAAAVANNPDPGAASVGGATA